MKQIKKWLVSFAVVVVGILLVACHAGQSSESESASDAPAETNKTTQKESGEVVKIGILQYVAFEALDDVRVGFEERLEEADLAYTIEINFENANGDQSTLQSMSETLARDNDIMFAIATPAAQALATAEMEKPIFFSAVTDPEEAGLVESNEAPGRNLTGTSDRAPLEEQVDLLQQIVPDAQTVGMIYNSSEVNSKLQVEQATELLEAAGMEVEIATVTSTNDISQVLIPLVQKVDVLFGVTDNTIDSAITLVGDIAKEENVPFIGSSESIIVKNGLATVSNSYKDYGRQTADMLIKHLQEGTPVSELPVEFAKDYDIIVNEVFADAIGIDLSSLNLSVE